MNAHEVRIKDVSEHGVQIPVTIPVPILNWLREHDLRDLEGLLLEMHSAGEDITEYSQMLEELEDCERALKIYGDVPATDEDLNPYLYVEEEMKQALG